MQPDRGILGIGFEYSMRLKLDLRILFFLGPSFFLGLCDLRLGWVAVAVAGLRLGAHDRLFESRVSHASGMTICNGCCEEGTVCDLVPVDLRLYQPRFVVSISTYCKAILLTSFKVFCCRIANRNRETVKSLLEAMLAVIVG